MPQTKAAAKALRTSERRRAGNDRWRRKIRESLHAVRDAMTDKDQKKTQEAVMAAESVLDRAARRNIIHPNKAARKKSQIKSALAKLK